MSKPCSHWPAFSTASASSRASALAWVRTRSSGTTTPSVSVRIGLTASADPIRAAAAPTRPPRLRYSSVSTYSSAVEDSPARRAASATSAASFPASRACAGPAGREPGRDADLGRVDAGDRDRGLLRGQHGRVERARHRGAEVHRHDLPRRPRTPASRTPTGSRSGVGRDVLTGTNAASASAIISDVTSTPSVKTSAPMMTCSGTTVMFSRAASCTDRRGRRVRDHRNTSHGLMLSVSGLAQTTMLTSLGALTMTLRTSRPSIERDDVGLGQRQRASARRR